MGDSLNSDCTQAAAVLAQPAVKRKGDSLMLSVLLLRFIMLPHHRCRHNLQINQNSKINSW